MLLYRFRELGSHYIDNCLHFRRIGIEEFQKCPHWNRRVPTTYIQRYPHFRGGVEMLSHYYQWLITIGSNDEEMEIDGYKLRTAPSASVRGRCG